MVLLYVFFGILTLVGIALVVFMIKDKKEHPTVCCFVITEGAPIFNGPGPGYKQVGKTKIGEVKVVGCVRDWWKLKNGTFVESINLEPKNWGEYPVEL